MIFTAETGDLTGDVTRRGLKAFFELLANKHAHTPLSSQAEQEKQDLSRFAVKFFYGCFDMAAGMLTAAGNAAHGFMTGGKYRYDLTNPRNLEGE